MNPISLLTRAVTLPARTAGAVVGGGLHVSARVVGWVVERAAGGSPERTAQPWTQQKSADEPAPVAVAQPESVAPAAPPARKAPAKKAPAKKSVRKAPSKKAAVVAPALGLSEAEAEDVLRTPSGIPAAGDGTNPDTTETDLHQRDTEPLMDPATTKSVAKESRTLRKGAERDKG